MSRFKLLVTDLDGTLLDHGGEVHARDHRAIAKLLERGIHVSICTGRLYSGTRDIARSVGVSGAVGCLDGSQVVDSRTDEQLATHPIEGHVNPSLLEALREFEPVTFLLSGDSILHDDTGDPYLSFIGVWSRRSVRLERVLDQEHFGHQASVAALVSLGQPDQIRGAAYRLLELAGDHVQIGFFNVKNGYDTPAGMVIRAAGVSKATALTRIADHYGVSLSETVAVGDWLNDISMLQQAGMSFAMGHAPDEVKEVASEVLWASVDDGGGIEEAAERAGML